MVRIEPRKPCGSINFLEWDGLIRLCFSRKNKTLGAIFRQPSTLALLHNNFQLCQALATPGAQKESGDSAAKSADAMLPQALSVDEDDDIDMSEGEGDGEDEAMEVDGERSAQVWPPGS